MNLNFIKYLFARHVPIKINRCRNNAIIPKYAYETDTGADLFSCENKVIGPGETEKIATGIILEAPQGFGFQVRSRSGMAAKYGVHVLNSPGTADNSYRSEIFIILHNTSSNPYIVGVGDRVAQLIVEPVIQGNFIETNILSSTERGKGGLGSTGK